MPPPRRRRPVQPATRVRLPRTARARGTPGADAAPAGWTESENGHAADPGGEAGPGVAAGLAEPGTAERAEPGTAERAEPETAGPAEPGTAGPAEPETAGPAEPGTAGPAGAETAGPAEAETAGLAEPETAGLAEAAAGERDEGGAVGGTVAAGVPAVREREPVLLPACFGVLAVILGGLAVWFGVNAGSASSPSSAFGTNMAVSNAAATAEVNRQIDSAVNTIFSYNYADTARTARAASSLLTGAASQQYASLFRLVQQEAPQEKLVLTTTVTNSGVETLTADSARLLIFANQQDTAAKSHSTTEAGAMFAVTAKRQDGRWKIESIDTFSAGG